MFCASPKLQTSIVSHVTHEVRGGGEGGGLGGEGVWGRGGGRVGAGGGGGGQCRFPAKIGGNRDTVGPRPRRIETAALLCVASFRLPTV